jgi:imidazolonepropionase-like amidohydrolase
MSIKASGPRVQTILPPKVYPTWQLDRAVRIAKALERGVLILIESPHPSADHHPDPRMKEPR